MLYFRGCTAREKQTSIAEATEKLLNLAGVDYHILKDEACCGSVLLRTGFLKEAQEQIAKMLGYNRAHYARFENGTAEITLRFLEALQKAFGITFDEAKVITKRDNE